MWAIGPPKELKPSFVKASRTSRADPGRSPVLVAAVLLAALFSPFVFMGGFYLALVGMLLWGVGYATQDTLLKAMVAGVLPEGQRNFAFGLYYAGHGVGWLIGSVATGLRYEQSRMALIAFAILVQVASLPIFAVARSREPNT